MYKNLDLSKISPDGGEKFNRLIFEESPYLLQHAENPVDWYAWGDEAFQKAKKENKLIFLSIGYSTCHWCHVMEHESFENQEIADCLNQDYISIKVDREERPDIDNVYITLAQLMVNTAGWPLTIILNPEKKPFFVATYIPPVTSHNRKGMVTLLPEIAGIWKDTPEEILESGNSIATKFQAYTQEQSSVDLDSLVFAKTNQAFLEQYDKENAGFKGTRKFPSPQNYLYLLSQWRRTQDPQLLEVVTSTLSKIRHGGIFDQIGFGFHRYSTDPYWILPHFEKMLYDQAMLVLAYTDTYQVTNKIFYQNVAQEIIEYVERELLSSEGGFYSAEDADSEGEEGKFYVWTLHELRSVLTETELQICSYCFNIKTEGNFHDESTGLLTQENIFYLYHSMDRLEKDFPKINLPKALESIRKKLFLIRENRVHPFKDDKIITSWNALMITALARAGKVFHDNHYIETAKKGASFIWEKLRDADGNLLLRFCNGKSSKPAHINDYAFFIQSLIELYEATFEISWLEKAIEIQKIMISQFYDEDKGGFFFTSKNTEKLLVRLKEGYDGAVPSGNSVTALNLLKLGRISSRVEWESMARSIFKIFGQSISQTPTSFAQMLIAADFDLSPTYEIVIVGEDNHETQNLIQKINQFYFHEKVILLKTPKNSKALAKIAPYTKTLIQLDKQLTIYICQDFVCQLPVHSWEEVQTSLKLSIS
jgi:uncharacterized protein YyaL (SSP411 family)